MVIADQVNRDCVPARWLHKAPDGCLGWQDGDPPTVVQAAELDDVNTAFLAAPALPEPTAPTRVRNWVVRVIFNHNSLSISAADVVGRVRSLQATHVQVALVDIGYGLGWSNAARWIEELRSLIGQSAIETVIAIEVEIHTPEHLTDNLVTLATRYAVGSFRFVDHGRETEASDRMLDIAASFADAGVAVNGSLILHQSYQKVWQRTARSWYAVTHGHGLSLELPESVPGTPGTTRCDNTHIRNVADMFASVYRDKRFDLWRVSPFCKILQLLCLGSQSIASEIVVNNVHVGADGDVGSPIVEALCSKELYPVNCSCNWAPACRTITLSASHGTLPREESTLQRVRCMLASEIVPMMLEDWHVAVRAECANTIRPAEERYRIAARDGRVTVWNDSVIRGHRNRFEEIENVNSRDLSSIRSRVTGDHVIEPGPARPA